MAGPERPPGESRFTMRWLAFILLAATPLCFAGSACPDPRLREATIGGDTIEASVELHRKPFVGAQVRLYFSSGKTAWAGVTDKKGAFMVKDLPPDTYKLDVRGWGSTTVRLNQKLSITGNGQRPHFSVQLMDQECISFIEVVN